MMSTDKHSDSNLICVPGQRLCLADENTIAGLGTYERQGNCKMEIQSTF